MLNHPGVFLIIKTSLPMLRFVIILVDNFCDIETSRTWRLCCLGHKRNGMIKEKESQQKFSSTDIFRKIYTKLVNLTLEKYQKVSYKQETESHIQV